MTREYATASPTKPRDLPDSAATQHRAAALDLAGAPAHTTRPRTPGPPHHAAA